MQAACEAVLQSPSEDNVVRLLELWSPEWKHRGRVAAQSRRGPRARQVPPVRELPPGDLKELAGIPHVEVPGQLLQQPDGLLLRHF